MATIIRNTDPLLVPLAAAFNDLKAQIGAGAFFHLDKCEIAAIVAPVASDLATSLVLCNELIGFLRFHFADLLAHKVIDATALPALGAALDLASAQTAANLMKATYNTHIASTTYHYNADATNAIAAADASNQGTLNTLLNEMRTDCAAHTQSGPAAKSLRLVGA